VESGGRKKWRKEGEGGKRPEKWRREGLKHNKSVTAARDILFMARRLRKEGRGRAKEGEGK
jgi:hypothetical protein